ncbi:MAG TPA: hypothetical protein VJ770_29610 [Stellaceae bacterium]|nr:hypothetical protein [Stellaceae bacterium]
MSFAEIAKRTGRGLALATALAGAVSLTAAPGAAYARDHGGWHGGGWHDHHGWGGGGIALGVLGGAIAGAAIANSYYGYPYYGYAYPYSGGGYYPYYGYGY